MRIEAISVGVILGSFLSTHMEHWLQYGGESRQEVLARQLSNCIDFNIQKTEPADGEEVRQQIVSCLVLFDVTNYDSVPDGAIIAINEALDAYDK